jgi:hypothetical protein
VDGTAKGRAHQGAALNVAVIGHVAGQHALERIIRARGRAIVQQMPGVVIDPIRHFVGRVIRAPAIGAIACFVIILLVTEQQPFSNWIITKRWPLEVIKVVYPA